MASTPHATSAIGGGYALPVALLSGVIAFGLRLVLLGQHAFHMDEALYACLSKRVLHGDLLLTGGLNNDKPPLQFYLGALGLALFGDSESAIRLLNALVSALECGLLAYALAPLAGGMAALGAGLLLACAPLHRSFGATAVMDGPLSALLLLSFALGARGRSMLSGLAWAGACWAKQTAVFFLPFPLAALLIAVPSRRGAAVKDWSVGAALGWAPLLAWSLLLQHPHLGMILGMAAHQPEVGLQTQGLLGRLGDWSRLGTGSFIFGGAFQAMAWGLPFLGLLLLLRQKGREARAWALSTLVPAYGLLVFAGLNMRHFDRYYLPLAFALAAAPALLVGLLPEASLWRRAAGLAVLTFGLAGLYRARLQAADPLQQGAAGSAFDGYRDILHDLDRLEPDGARAGCPEGALRWMGGWYLPKSWSLSDSQDEINASLAEARDPRPFWLILHDADPAPQGWEPMAVEKGDGLSPPWRLYRRTLKT